MSNELAEKSIEHLSTLLRTQEVSPVELTASIFNQIRKKDTSINAYIDVYEDEAKEAALQAENEIMTGNYRGPLHGIPMALKDNFYFKGRRMTAGSKIHENFIPAFDATVVKKLKEAGVIFTGTLNMHEYAKGVTTTNPHYGTCRNPWDLDRVPGGSSGGSGAAVAGHMTIASLGSDTGGSIRGPAAACGVIGLKPTYGRISKYGCFPLAWTLDHVGPLTKTVYDAALLLETLAGYDKNDPSSVNKPSKGFTNELTGDVQDIVIGIEESYFFHDIESDVEKLVKGAIHKLERLGAKVECVRIPSLPNLPYAQLITNTSEASTIHRQNLLERPYDFGDDVRPSLYMGELISAVDYLQAQQIRRQICKEFEQVFEKVDVLISPTNPFPATYIGENKIMLNNKEVNLSEHVGRLTRPSNLTGIPAISIPCGLSHGLPVGLQIMGAPFQEETILNVAKAIEQLDVLKGMKPAF